jgi:Ca2+-binding RTX toxin-like protein
MGNNTILGNSGTNTLIGGLGDDTYGVDSLSDVVTELAGEGTDTINASFTYTLADNLENLTLTGMDTISGTGNAADNTITGNAAANTLTGGTGADTLIGGEGNDIFNVDNIGDVVTEMMNEGIDTVNSSVTYTLGANVENLALQGTADISGTGNMLNNNLVGNTGANTLTGGLGDDVYDVDNAGDVVTELLGEGDDTVNSTITHTLGENIENLNLLGTSDLNGTGNTLNNTLEGNAGSNSLDGGVGNDTILANGGDDTVDGGAGNDALSGGSGLDVLNGGADNDTLFGNEGNDVLNGGLGDDTLNGGAGDDSINGGDGSDTAVFTASSTSVTVDVQNGALVIGSGQGTDTVGMDIEFLAFSDQTLSFTNTATLIGQNTGTSTPAIVMGTTAEQLRGFQLDYGSVLTSTARENANFGLTSLSSTRLLFEDVTLGYSLEFTGPGLGQSSSLTELNTAVSTGLSTGAFTNATLSGPLGNNQGNGTVMSLDTGTEFGGISVGASYTLSSGNQTFEVDGALPTSVEQFEGLGRAFAQLPDFETFGSTQQTTLTNELMTLGVNEVRMQSGFGTTFGYDISDDFAVSVSYAGAGGNDDLSGGGGTDTINGMDGNDTIRGFLGDDVLNGGEGNDRLLGAEGNDNLNCGDGADVLNGGVGDDFIFGGFSSADLRDVVFAGAGNDSIDAGYGNDEIFGQDGNDIIAGGFGSDTLQGQNGNDVLTGSALSDLVFGNEGDDFVNGGFGHDRINGGTGADRFFHLGILDHGSDFIQDYSTTEGDLLLFGQVGATRDQFQININDAVAPDGEKAGDDAIQEAFVIYRPTGQIMWALIDGAGQSSIDLRLGGETVSFGLGIDF